MLSPLQSIMLMPLSPVPCYPQYYLDPSARFDYIISMHHQDHGIPQSNMPPARSPQIDPALSLYPPYYSYQQPQQHIGHHLTVPQNLPSPSSQGSDTMGTPPNDNLSYSPGNSNGKRPSSSLVGAMGESSRKKARSEDSLDGHSPAADKDEPKPKTTRGSR
jgi:hypothetical protein